MDQKEKESRKKSKYPGTKLKQKTTKPMGHIKSSSKGNVYSPRCLHIK